MNRSFKIEFHNNEPDEKPIVTLAYRVDNGKRYGDLTSRSKEHLVTNIERFQKSLEIWKQEIITSMNPSKQQTP